jgi:hypothetical protein
MDPVLDRLLALKVHEILIQRRQDFGPTAFCTYMNLCAHLSQMNRESRDFLAKSLLSELQILFPQSRGTDAEMAWGSFIAALFWRDFEYEESEGFIHWLLAYFLEAYKGSENNAPMNPRLIYCFLLAFSDICYRYHRFCKELLKFWFQCVLEELLEQIADESVIRCSLILLKKMLKWDATEIGPSPAILTHHARSTNEDIAILSLEVIKILVKKRDNEAKNYSSDDILHFFSECLRDAPFGIKTKALECLLAVVGSASGSEVAKIARFGFLQLFFEILKDVENENQRIMVLRAIEEFMDMGVTTNGPNCFEDAVIECGGVDVLWDISEHYGGCEGNLACTILSEHFPDAYVRFASHERCDT